MFNPRIFNDQENYDETGFNPAAYFLPTIPLEAFTGEFFPRDDSTYCMNPEDLEALEQKMPFFMDPALYQTFQEDMKKFMPDFDFFSGLFKDGTVPEIRRPEIPESPPAIHRISRKIGSITVEERREKVRKYLEKRKNKVFKKRISYICRKRVADSRIRVKGRFVTKEQASVLISNVSSKTTGNA